MKGITINDVEYLPATALAKQFRYTTDYIGQLCRAKKVDAQLVGRSWYVNPESLTSHKKARYVKLKLGENISDKANEITLSRLEVEPVVSKNTVKMSESTSNNYAKRIDWKPLRYEADAGDLIPNFNREPESTKVQINLAESTELSVKAITKSTKMIAEDLPLVSLKGKLKISSLNEDFSTKEDVIEEEVPLPPLPKPLKEANPRALHLSLPVKEARDKVLSEVRPLTSTQLPKSVAIPSQLFIPKGILNQVEEENGIEFVEVTLITTTGLLVMCLLLLFFGESSVSANSSSYTWGIDFSTTSLTALASLFSY
jgi:hypothetical protein